MASDDLPPDAADAEAAPEAAEVAEVATDAPAAAEGGVAQLTDNDAGEAAPEGAEAARVAAGGAQRDNGDDERLRCLREGMMGHLASAFFMMMVEVKNGGEQSEDLKAALGEMKAALDNAIGISRRITTDGEPVGDEDWQRESDAARDAGRQYHSAWTKNSVEKGKGAEVAAPRGVGGVQLPAVVEMTNNNGDIDSLLVSPRGYDSSVMMGGASVATAPADEDIANQPSHATSENGKNTNEKRKLNMDMKFGPCAIELEEEFEFSRHVALSTSKASALEERIRSEYKKFRGHPGKKDGTDMHLMISAYDSCTPFILTFIEFSLGVCDARKVAAAASRIGTLFRTRMTALTSRDVRAEPLSALMWWIAAKDGQHCWDANEALGSKQMDLEEQPFVKASDSALKRFNKSEGRKFQKWHKVATIGKGVKPFLSIVAYDLAVLRVLEIVAIERLMKIALETGRAKQEEIDKFRALIDNYLPGQWTTLKAARVLEVIVSVMNGDDSNDKGVAIRLAAVMAIVLGFEQCKEYFATAEALPIDVLIQDCTPEQLEEWKEQQTNPFLSAPGKQKQPQRKQASRKVLHGVLASSCARALCEHEDDGSDFGNIVAQAFAFGVAVYPPTSFKDDESKFLVEPQSHDPSDANRKHFEKLMKSGGHGDSIVQKIIKSAAASMKHFQDDHTWLELTDDLNSGEKTVLDLIEEHSACLLDDQKAEEEANGREEATDGDEESSNEDARND